MGKRCRSQTLKTAEAVSHQKYYHNRMKIFFKKHIKKLLIVKSLLRYSYWVFIWPGDMKSVNTRFSFWNGTALKNRNLIKNQMTTVSKNYRGSKTKVAHRSLHRITGLAVTLQLSLQCRSEQLAANKKMTFLNSGCYRTRQWDINV